MFDVLRELTSEYSIKLGEYIECDDNLYQKGKQAQTQLIGDKRFVKSVSEKSSTH